MRETSLQSGAVLTWALAGGVVACVGAARLRRTACMIAMSLSTRKFLIADSGNGSIRLDLFPDIGRASGVLGTVQRLPGQSRRGGGLTRGFPHIAFVIGCKKEEPKVEINMPGMNMKVNKEGGTINVTVPGK